MDEPLASLDASLRSGLRSEIEALVRSLDLTTVYVTHDQVEALTLAASPDPRQRTGIVECGAFPWPSDPLVKAV
jgi:ABC-type nitrate/sulfonate/bicarbonate transport system ATPase subunit